MASKQVVNAMLRYGRNYKKALKGAQSGRAGQLANIGSAVQQSATNWQSIADRGFAQGAAASPAELEAMARKLQSGG